jgi:hypothetical protein
VSAGVISGAADISGVKVGPGVGEIDSAGASAGVSVGAGETDSSIGAVDGEAGCSGAEEGETDSTVGTVEGVAIPCELP